jgi:hypothetical protein
VILTIPCSPEQTDVIADHLIYDAVLGVQPDERAWMLSQARKQHPTCKILKADLDLENAEWILTLDS